MLLPNEIEAFMKRIEILRDEHNELIEKKIKASGYRLNNGADFVNRIQANWNARQALKEEIYHAAY